jgi:hypothetical protein
MPLFKKSELDTVGLLRRPTVHAEASAWAIARENTMRVLGALADWGALKTEAVAALCFPTPRYSQGLLMAQRKLKDLAAANLLVSRIDAHGARCWVLSGAGGAMVGAKYGYSLNPAGCKNTHTHLGTRYMFFKQVCQGYTCYSEHAFTHNRCPVRTSDLFTALGKVPDGILLLPGAVRDPPQLLALETEVAIKSEAQISKQLGMLAQLGKRVCPDLPHVFAGLIVLFPAQMEWHAARLKRAARRRWSQCAAPQALADRVLIARADLGAGWAFKDAVLRIAGIPARTLGIVSLFTGHISGRTFLELPATVDLRETTAWRRKTEQSCGWPVYIAAGGSDDSMT